ncbi:MAG: hypothetical protein MK006_06915 [Pirellulales bacterium]|nr:hypothetical protein [Pirellulales bacterium]
MSEQTRLMQVFLLNSLAFLLVIAFIGCGDQESDSGGFTSTMTSVTDEVNPGGPGDQGTYNPNTQQSVVQEIDVPDPHKLFDGWAEPEFALVFTGRQHGYIEPCGCAGLEHQKGGLSRRHTFLNSLRDKGWDIIPIDAGNLVRRIGRQSEIKFQLTAAGMATMGYVAIGIGPDDLKLPSGELLATVADDGDGSSPYVSSNVSIIDRDLVPQYKVVSHGDKKIGIVSIIGETYLSGVGSDEILVEESRSAIRDSLSQLENENCDVLVLMIKETLQKSIQISEEFPQFKFVVTSGASGEPEYDLRKIGESGNSLIQIGKKGMYGLVLAWFESEQEWKYQRVSLTSRYEDSNEVLQWLKDYQVELQRLGFEGLGIRASEHPSGASFVGSKSCASCHQPEYETWLETPHAHATASLEHPTDRVDIPRQYDPECLSCHVTGWRPQQYTPYTSGFESLATSSHLTGNGCENCHGPGSDHVRVESADSEISPAEIQEFREAMQLSLDDAKRTTCFECHDLDNSPDFHDEGAFESYWERIVH